MKNRLNHLCALSFFLATMLNFMKEQTAITSLAFVSGICFLLSYHTKE